MVVIFSVSKALKSPATNSLASGCFYSCIAVGPGDGGYDMLDVLFFGFPWQPLRMINVSIDDRRLTFLL